MSDELTQRFIPCILDERIILKWVLFLLIFIFIVIIIIIIIIIICECEVESSPVR